MLIIFMHACPGAEGNLFTFHDKNAKNMCILCHDHLKTLYLFMYFVFMLYIVGIVVKVNGPFAASAVSGRFILFY